MTELPEPLTPPDCDCTDLDGFMLNVERLMASELVALGTHEEIAAALFLWCRAWKQRPAASLPDDDRVLAAFSRLPLVKFLKLKEQALHGFVKCSDGRLYHRVLSVEALRAWGKKTTFRTKKSTEAERLRKWRADRKPRVSEAPGNEYEPAPVHDGNALRTQYGNALRTQYVPEGQGQGQGQRKKKKKEDDDEKNLVAAREDAILARICAILRVELQANPDRITWQRQVSEMLHDGITELEIIAATEVARTHGKLSMAYIRAVALNRMNKPNGGGNGHDKPTPKPLNVNVDARAWRSRMRIFSGMLAADGAEAGSWSDEWGPKPGELGCVCPRSLIDEFGPAKAAGGDLPGALPTPH